MFRLFFKVLFVPNPVFFVRRLLKPLFTVVLFLSLISCDKNEVQNAPFVVGIINTNMGVKPIVESFKARLLELNLVDDRQIEFIEPVSVKPHEVDLVLATMKSEGVDLVFTSGTGDTLKAQKVFDTTSTSVIFAPVFDPVRSGVVKDLLHGNSSTTGVRVGGSNPKALEFALMADPNLKKILIPYSGLSVVENFSLIDVQLAADKLGVELLLVKVKSSAELEEAMRYLNQDIDAIWLLHSMFLAPRFSFYVKAAIENNVLLISGTGLGKRGVMVSYSHDYVRTGHQVARLAHQISRGVSARNLPIETADFFLSVNLDSAQKAGFKISDELLRQADNIYID